MLAHKNGEYPLSLFVHRGGNIYLTPSLNARWNEMVRLGLAKYGVRLWITGDVDGLGGWNGYRPILPQRRYRAHYGLMAAYPGTSSHGGKFKGREVFAVDVANVDDLAPGNPSLARGRLTALAKAVGLTVNFVTPTEWWHVGDFNNAWSAPAFGAVAINPGTTNKPAPVEPPADLMEAIRMSQIRYVHRVEPGYDTEWMIAGMEVPGGFQTTTDEEVAVGWGALYGTDKGDSWKALNRKQYIKLQQSVAELHRRWVALQKTLR